MQCPNCSHEIEEGHLICEKCGYEVQIVPVFEPEIEPQIDNELILDETGGSSGTGELPGTVEFTDTEDIFDPGQTDQMLGVLRIRAGKKIIRNAMIVAVSLAVAAVIIIVSIVSARRAGSLEHQIDRAKDMASQGRYEDAIRSLENIYVSHPEESSLLLLEADYYQALMKNDQAKDTLMRLITRSGYSENDIFAAYDRLIAIYADEGDYSGINALLEDCDYPDVVMAYQNYTAMMPVFSSKPGEYAEALRLKINANTSGNIYYTLDGSVPNESSTRYDNPITLDHGEILVSAVFINQYGIVSDVATGLYVISNNIPVEPVVNVDSGEYHEPMLITATIPEGCTVYYTTDRSRPTVDSVKYTDPIPMPVKYSNFNFIAITEDGLESDVVVRSYSLSFPGGISYDSAINILKTRLIERGQIEDMEGHSDRAPGRFTYEVISAIPISGQGDYYTIREFYHDGTGQKTPTDTTYIVEIYQGSTAILGGNAADGFLAIAF